MVPKRKIKVLLVTSGGLGALVMLLLLQYHEGTETIATSESSPTVQTFPETQRRWVKPQSTKSPTIMKAPPRKVQTDPKQSDELENVRASTDIPNKTTALDGEDAEFFALVDSLSDEDIEVLEGLTLRDFLSDEEQKELDLKVFGALEEFTEIAPKIVTLRRRISALREHLDQLELDLDNPKDKAEFRKIGHEWDAMEEELETCEHRVPKLIGTLLNEEYKEYYHLDQEKIRGISKELLNGKGWSWYQPQDW